MYALALSRLGELTVGEIAAVGLGAYLFLVTLQRLMNDEDPSITKRVSSDVGTASFLVSGAAVSALLTGLIAWLTWPAPVERSVFGIFLVLIVVVHVFIEWRERDG